MKTEEKKDKIWCFKVTDDDLLMIRTLISKHSLNVSNFIRNSLKKKYEELEDKDEN